VTTVWDESEVAKRALELFRIELEVRSAYDACLRRTEKFERKNSIDRVDHQDSAYVAYTAKKFDVYQDAKRAAKRAKDRLTTACSNCLNGDPAKGAA